MTGVGDTRPDEVPMPEVQFCCHRCGVTWEEVESGYVVVSPTGFAHHGRNDGRTECGFDTAGETYRNWWWPL